MIELNPYANEVVKTRAEMIEEVEEELQALINRAVYLEGYLLELRDEQDISNMATDI